MSQQIWQMSRKEVEATAALLTVLLLYVAITIAGISLAIHEGYTWWYGLIPAAACTALTSLIIGGYYLCRAIARKLIR